MIRPQIFINTPKLTICFSHRRSIFFTKRALTLYQKSMIRYIFKVFYHLIMTMYSYKSKFIGKSIALSILCPRIIDLSLFIVDIDPVLSFKSERAAFNLLQPMKSLNLCFIRIFSVAQWPIKLLNPIFQNVQCISTFTTINQSIILLNLCSTDYQELRLLDIIVLTKTIKACSQN